MSFFCIDSAACQNDAAITILSKMYGNGFIQGFLTEGVVASQVQPGASDLAPVLLGGLASVAMTLAMVMFFCLLFTSLINSAQDGEAFGKGSSKVIIVVRFLASMAMLLPTASGYCMIQVVLMFLVLWSNGETNKLYNNVVQSGIISNTVNFNSAGKTSADVYGLRGHAMAHFRQLVCVKTLNAVYYGDNGLAAGPELVTHHVGGLIVDTSEIYLPTHGVGKVGAVEIKPKSGVSGTQVLQINLVDNGRKITNRPDEPICGSITYTLKDPQKLVDELLGSSGKNAAGRKILGYSEAQQTAVVRAIAKIQDAVQTSKVDHIDSTFNDMTRWAKDNIKSFDPTSTTLKEDLAGVDWLDLEGVVELKVENSQRAYRDLLNSNRGDVANAMNLVVQSLTSKGWTYAAGIRQRIIAIQADIQKVFEEESVVLQPPSLNIRVNDDRYAAVRHFIESFPSRFNLVYAAKQETSSEPTPAQIKEMVPGTLDEDAPIGASAQNIETGMINLVSNFQRDFIYTLMRGEFTTRNSMIEANNSGPIVGLDDNVDVLSNIQRSGELLLIFNNRLILTEVGLRGALLFSSVATAALPLGNERAKVVIDALIYWLEKVIMIPLGLLMKFAYILGVYMSVIIPSMPYFFFMTAVVAWYVHILQAMAGLPFWAVMHMVPERSFVGSQSQGYVTLVCLFMRPLLTLVGLFFGFLMANPILYFITDSFFAMQGSMIGSSSSTSFMMVVTELVTFQIWLTIYCTLVLQICYMIFGLAGTLPDSVLKWIGSGLNAGEWGSSDAKSSLSAGSDAAVKGGASPGGSSGNSDGKGDAKQATNGPVNGGGSDKGESGGGGSGGGVGGGGSTSSNFSSTPANNVRSGADDAQAQMQAQKANDQGAGQSGQGSISDSGKSANDGGGTGVGGHGSDNAPNGNATTIGGDTASKQDAIDNFKAQGGLLNADGKPMNNLDLINARAHDKAPRGVQTAMIGGAIGGAIKSIANRDFGNFGKNMAQGANVAGHAHFANHGGAAIKDKFGNQEGVSGKGNVQGVIQNLKQYHAGDSNNKA